MTALWAAELLKLQAIDAKIRGVQTRLSLLPKERDRIVGAKRAADAEAAAAETRLAEFRAGLRRMESEIKTLEEKRDRIRQQSALVKKNDEYQTMLRESAMLDRAIGEMEAKTLAEMDRLPEVEKAVVEVKKKCVRTVRELKQEYMEFGAAEKSFQADLAALRRERAAAAEMIDAKLLQSYEELHKSGEGQAVVPIGEDGSCGHCCLKLTPQTLAFARAGKFTQCDNCSHLVYMENV